MARIAASRFHFVVFTLLTMCGIAWLCFLIGLKEFWGFWQSPAEYYYLKYEYPEWIRTYVFQAFYPTLYFVLLQYVAWMALALSDLRSFTELKQFSKRLALILCFTLWLGGALGVLCANNYIGWLHEGKLHGVTHLPVQP